MGLYIDARPGDEGFNLREDVRYVRNEALKTIVKDYPGNPVVDGRFLNEVKKADLSFFKVLDWYLSTNPQRKEKKEDPFKLKVTDCAGAIHGKKDLIVWLGHSTFFIRIGGRTILTDPVLFDPPFLKRKIALPCGIADIKKIDYLLVSHTHYDHLDKKTVKRLDLRNTTALVPLKMGALLKKFNPDLEIQEAGWYQQFKSEGVEIFLLPAQHWSKRGIGGTNEILWGSYIIRYRNKTIYFAGDTSYAPHFKKIAAIFGRIDICLMPVGAYKPPHIMQLNHISPWQAVDAFHDLRGKFFVPMHYGTFDLSDEPPGEPERVLREMKTEGKIRGGIEFLSVGKTFDLQSFFGR